MKPIKSVKLLPNVITAANLFCGFLSIVVVARALGVDKNDPEYAMKVMGLLGDACKYIVFAMVFDALDGKVARMVKGTSDFGAQLDSLCDAVSFCVAPAFLVYVTCRIMPDISAWFPDGMATYEVFYHEEYLFIFVAMYVLCGIMRLARFNVETTEAEEDHQYFKGLPTPAAAAVLVSWVVLLFNPTVMKGPYQQDVGMVVLYSLPLICMISAILMVSSVPYVHVVSLMGRSRASFEILVMVIVVAIFTYINFYLTMFVAMLLYLLTGLLGLKKKFGKFKTDALEQDN